MAGILTRLSTIIRANINYLLDRLEDPERVLRHAIAELDETIARARGALEEADVSERVLHDEVERQRTESDAFHQAARRALEQGNETSAREALAKEQAIERALSVLLEDRQTAAETRRLLDEQLQALNTHRNELERKRQLLTTRRRAADAGAAMQQSLGDLDAQQRVRDQLRLLEERTLHAEDRRAALSEQIAESEHIARKSSEPDETIETALERLRHESRKIPKLAEDAAFSETRSPHIQGVESKD